LPTFNNYIYIYIYSIYFNKLKMMMNIRFINYKLYNPNLTLKGTLFSNSVTHFMLNSPTHPSQNLWMILRMYFIRLKIYYYCCCYCKKTNKQKINVHTYGYITNLNKNLRTTNKGYIC